MQFAFFLWMYHFMVAKKKDPTSPLSLSYNHFLKTQVQAISSYPKQIKNKMTTSLVKFFFYILYSISFTGTLFSLTTWRSFKPFKYVWYS